MGDAGTTLLRQCWSDLARASEALDIGPDRPDYCAAELYWHARQSSDTVRTAQVIPGAAQRWWDWGITIAGKPKRQEGPPCVRRRHARLARAALLLNNRPDCL